MGKSTTVVRAGTILAGRELEPMTPGTLVIEGSGISALGPSRSIDAPSDATVVDAPRVTLLPGFIDCHVHIGFADPIEVLAGGVTTARDLGWPPERIHPLARASADGGFTGPLVLAAGPILTAPGGYPSHAQWAPEGTARIVDGPDDAHEAVALTAAEGATVVKVALDESAGPTLGPVTLKAITDAAHRRDLRVTGHVHGLPELVKALDAGLDELAHMLLGPDELPGPLVTRMVRDRVAVVPTLSIRFGPDQTRATGNVARFAAAGGTILYGTDFGNRGPRPGIDAREVAAMARAGMSGRRIIASATVEAARALRLAGAGSLEPGKVADVIGVDGDPLEEPLALARVRMVWRGGNRVARLRNE
jgi:imidazolonepropionase-like amidohydrolase